MNTLTSNPVAALLDRRSKTEYAELYRVLKDIPLSVSRDTGRLLYLLVRSTRCTSTSWLSSNRVCGWAG